MRLPVMSCALLVALAACGGTTPPVSTGVVPMNERIVTGGGSMINVNRTVTDPGVSKEIAVPVAEAWRVLPQVYEDLKIGLSYRNDGTRTLGAEGFKARRRIGELRMEKLLDCGATTGPNAETFNIVANIVTAIATGPKGGTLVTTTFTATGSSPFQASSVAVRCTTTGELEQYISGAVAKKILGG